MTLNTADTGPALPPWSLTAAGRDSEPATAKAVPPGDTDFGQDEGYMFGEDGLTFGDILDIINPLQHLPVVSTLYRAVTGDAISPGARMVGGAIFGGPTGFAAAVVNNAMADHTGRDVGENVLAAFVPDGEPQTPDTAVALARGPENEPQDAVTAETAPPATLTAAGADDRPAEPLFNVTGQSPLLTPDRSRPLIDRGARPQPFVASETAPPKPQAPQIAAAPPVTPVRAEPAAAKPDPVPAPERLRTAPDFPLTPLDPALIPEAMLSALEKYEQMKRGS